MTNLNNARGTFPKKNHRQHLLLVRFRQNGSPKQTILLKGSQETRLGHGLTQTKCHQSHKKSSEHSLTNKHSKWTNSNQMHTKFIPNLPNLNLVHFFNKKRRMGGLLGSNHPKRWDCHRFWTPNKHSRYSRMPKTPQVSVHLHLSRNIFQWVPGWLPKKNAVQSSGYGEGSRTP